MTFKDIILVIIFVSYLIFSKIYEEREHKKIQDNSIDIDNTLVTFKNNEIQVYKINQIVKSCFQEFFDIINLNTYFESRNGFLVFRYDFENVKVEELKNDVEKFERILNKKLVNYYENSEVMNYVNVSKLVYCELDFSKEQFNVIYYYKYKSRTYIN